MKKDTKSPRLDRSGTLPASLAPARRSLAAGGHGDAQGSAYLDQAKLDWIHAAEHFGGLGSRDPFWGAPDEVTIEARVGRLRGIPNAVCEADIASMIERGRFKLPSWKSALDKLYAMSEATVEGGPAGARDLRERWTRYPAGRGPAEVTFDKEEADGWKREDPARVIGPPDYERPPIGRIKRAIVSEHGEPLASTWPRQIEVDEDGKEHEVGGLGYWRRRSGLGRLVDLFGAVAGAVTLNGYEWGGRL